MLTALASIIKLQADVARKMKRGILGTSDQVCKWRKFHSGLKIRCIRHRKFHKQTISGPWCPRKFQKYYHNIILSHINPQKLDVIVFQRLWKDIAGLALKKLPSFVADKLEMKK